MKYINININSENDSFKYIIEYDDDPQYMDLSIPYTKYMNRVDVLTGDVVRIENNWVPINKWVEDKNVDNILLNNPCNTSKIRIYFPDYSVDTYKHTKYAITFNTWINGIFIYLGSYILDRNDSLATVKKINNEKYHEYIELNIIDAWDIAYSDNWKEFREIICGENNGTNKILNNTGAQLNVSLYPVEYVDDNYVKLSDYVGGQNSINISNIKTDYLKLNLTSGFNNDGELYFKNSLIFNKIYNDNIKEYILETYDKSLSNIKYNIIIKDKNNLYKFLEKISLNTSETFNKNLFNYNEWNEWEEGLVIMGSASFLNDSGEEIIYILSNEIPLTQDIFKYMIISEINKINLDDINMNKYEINAINKNINNIIRVNKPDSSKNNISQPIFFKTRDLNNLIIHPNVIENICLNLDTYKSRVKTFYLQIGNSVFKQIGSNGYGILFKINGNQLEKGISEGIYHILNEDYELVSSGKYIIQL